MLLLQATEDIPSQKIGSTADTVLMDPGTPEDERLRPPLSTHDLTRCDLIDPDSDLISSPAKPARQSITTVPAAGSSKKKSVMDELDDLLGDSDPPISSKQKSPVKRCVHKTTMYFKDRVDVLD